MEIVKKNIISILCGVVVLLALISLVWPLGGMFTELQTLGEERKGVYNSMQGLLKKQRNLPIVDPTKTEAVPLPQFPNQPTIDKGESATKHVHRASVEMFDYVVQLNQRQPLVMGALPSGPDTQAFQFREAYLKMIKEVLPHDILKGGVPPTPADITAATDKLTELYNSRIVYVNGQPWNKEEVFRTFPEEAAQIPVRLRLAVSNTAKIYLSPESLTLDTGMENKDLRPNALQIWWAQVGVWIQKDVCEAIANANKNSTNVQNAVVKHLVKLNVSNKTFVGAPNVATGPGAPPPPVLDPNAPPPKNNAISLTGRISNPLYDVLHFKLVVNVDGNRLANFLTELSRNKLMTVLSMDIVALDPVVAQSAGFIYGPDKVVQVSLNCEALLLRKWTEPLMPGVLKRSLGIPDPPPAAPVAMQ